MTQPECKHIHAAVVVIALDESAIDRVTALLDADKQLLVIIPYTKDRYADDAFARRLIDTIEAADAGLSSIQIGRGRGKKWRSWLRRIEGSRSFIITPADRGEPSVTVAWLPEVETGIPRLVIAEFSRFGSISDNPSGETGPS